MLGQGGLAPDGLAVDPDKTRRSDGPSAVTSRAGADIDRPSGVSTRAATAQPTAA